MSDHLKIEELRLDIMIAAIIAAADVVEDITDVAAIPRLKSWAPHLLAATLDHAISIGCLVDSCDGRLIAKRRSGATL